LALPPRSRVSVVFGQHSVIGGFDFLGDRFLVQVISIITPLS